jgi:protein involved in polysaccharide export with SLBB domain
MRFRSWYLLCLIIFSAVFSNAENDRALQSGDIVYIAFPSETLFNQEFSIDVDGRINVPELGLFEIAGQPISQAEVKLRQLLSLLYLNASEVTLSLREANVMITVMGYVRKPGLITIPARGNVQTAIQAAGGLIPGAQLDQFQLQRAEEATVFSFKQYLDTGDTGTLPQLESMDVLFVPASPLTGNVQIDFDAATLSSGGDAGEGDSSFRIFGEVRSAGRYSLKENMTIIDAIMRAGGVTRYAGVDQIKVIANNQPESFNLKRYLETGDTAMLPTLTSNMTIFVPIQEEEIKTGSNVVYVMGEVFKPGAFESKPGAGFLDILANAGGPTRFADSRQIRILHSDGRVSPFDLVAFTESGRTEVLPDVLPGDAIFIPEKTDTNEASWLKTPPNRAIYIIGQVYSPGRYEWSDEMSMMDLLAHAKGPTAKADIANIRVLSPQENGDVLTQIFNLDTFVRQGGTLSDLPKLRAGETVVVPELPQDPTDNKAYWIRQAKEDSIYVFGQVGSPGRYLFNPSMTFLDILSAADGPTDNADIHRIRIIHRNDYHAQYSELNLSDYFQTGDEWLLPQVLPGDAIYVPEKDANWLDVPKSTVVKVMGAVRTPGRYEFNDSMTVLDLLAQAGGPTESAYLKRILVMNTSRLETRSVTFNLIRFLKRPDKAELPILRAGDTLFIPDQSESFWRVTMGGVRDLLSVLSVVAIVGGL